MEGIKRLWQTHFQTKRKSVVGSVELSRLNNGNNVILIWTLNNYVVTIETM